VVVGAIVVFVMMRGKEGGGEPGGTLSASEAVKQGDAAFKKHDYEKASELYEQAVAEGTTPPNRKKALEEAKGERVYKELKGAVAGDPDNAKALFDKCASEGTYWCTQAQTEFAEPVKTA